MRKFSQSLQYLILTTAIALLIGFLDSKPSHARRPEPGHKAALVIEIQTNDSPNLPAQFNKSSLTLQVDEKNEISRFVYTKRGNHKYKSISEIKSAQGAVLEELNGHIVSALFSEDLNAHTGGRITLRYLSNGALIASLDDMKEIWIDIKRNDQGVWSTFQVSKKTLVPQPFNTLRLHTRRECLGVKICGIQKIQHCLRPEGTPDCQDQPPGPSDR